jgi:GAF domain-containing protein/HAMP domain-containing protein
MDKVNRIPSLGHEILKRTGGWYPFVIVFFAQLVTSPLGILLAAISAQTNADFNAQQTYDIAIFVGSAMLVRNILLLLLVFVTNRTMIRRLSTLTKGNDRLADEEHEDPIAWKQITSFSWRYITAAFLSLIILALLPVIGYMNFALGMNAEQALYVVFAGLAAGMGLAVLEILIIESLLSPAREILLPKDFQAQLAGIKGIRLLPRFLIIAFSLIIVGILLVAPVGYHQTIVALSGRIPTNQVIANIRIELITASIGALLLGLILSYLMANTLSNPIRQMINVFDNVESGDLTQRIRIVATDEIGELALHFNQMISNLETLQSNLEEQIAARTQQLAATIDVGRAASSSLDIDSLVSNLVNLITDRFGYYYASIFLIDSSGRWAELIDATGIAGQALKERGHKLEVGSKSMVSTCITTRKPVIALDVGKEPVRFENPLLPDTRSEIALPLIAGERIIGVLDIQSTQENAFAEKELSTLQSLTDQIAVSLENARLFQQTLRSLEELRSTHRMYLSEAWTDTAREHGLYEYISGGEASDSTDTAAINVPLTLREQIIGELHLEGQQEWTPEEKTLIEAVATQAALALENARLLDESRQMALRERLAAEITGKVWSSPNIDFILQTAIKELGRALRADEATIELKME